jgi:hypothetical protein
VALGVNNAPRNSGLLYGLFPYFDKGFVALSEPNLTDYSRTSATSTGFQADL